MSNRTLTIAAVLCFAMAAAATTPDVSVTPEPAATATPADDAAKPDSRAPSAAEDDAVVIAAQRAARMHEQATEAAAQAVKTATHGGPLAQAQRHLLMATALLYTSSAQLERVAQKEKAYAERWHALGEQKGRAAASLEDEAARTETERKSKAYVAYGAMQATIAEAMLDFAKRQQALAKEADAAAKASSGEPLEESARNITEQNEAAKELAQRVVETRAKLATLAP